jgi:hypothetical protein
MRFAGVVLVLALAACKPPPPPVEVAAEPIARAFFDEVRTGGDIESDPHVARELKNPTSEEQLAEFRAMIPPGPYGEVEIRENQAVSDSTGVTTRITHAYHYPNQTVIAQTALFRAPSGKDPVIVGFKVSLEPGPGG